MAKINEIDITSLTFQEGSAPTTPASTKWKAYFKTDGIYVIDDAGAETGPLAAATVGLGAWTSYTPTWTGSGSNPAIGNGTLVGRYKALDSKTYAIAIEMTAGSTTTYGTGTWSFALPSVTAASTRRQMLSALCIDAGTANHTAIAKINSSDTKISEIRTAASSGAPVSSSVPMTWATGDVLTITGLIEVQ